MITHLTLEKCEVPCTTPFHFISHILSLETFSYPYRTPNDLDDFGRPIDLESYKPYLIRDGLIEFRKTLRTIRITGGSANLFPPSMGSLVELEAPEEVHTQWISFRGKIRMVSVSAILPRGMQELIIGGHPRNCHEQIRCDPVATLAEAITRASRP